MVYLWFYHGFYSLPMVLLWFLKKCDRDNNSCAMTINKVLETIRNDEIRCVN